MFLAISIKTTAASIAVNPSPPIEAAKLVKFAATMAGNVPTSPPIRRKITNPAIAIAKPNSVIFQTNLLIG